jgi:hypothetical protein
MAANYFNQIPDIAAPLQRFLSHNPRCEHSNPRDDVIRAAWGLAISGSENGGQYRSCLRLAASFENQTGKIPVDIPISRRDQPGE